MPTSESQGKPKTGRAYGTKVIWSQADPRMKKLKDKVLTFLFLAIKQHKHLKGSKI